MTSLISIIIPTKDEPLLRQLLSEIDQAVNATPHEVIVIDKSKMPPELNKSVFLLRQRSNGLGRAIEEAIPSTHGDLIITMDADGSHDPRELSRLIEASRSFDIVFGSRFVQGGRTLDAGSRKSVSKTYRWLARRVLHLPLEDPMSGFCAIHREVFNAVKLNPVGYKVNLELAYKASRKGFTITEIPITFYPRRAGRSKAGVKEGLRTFFFIFALRLGLR